jgi:hypothetical protein
MRKIFAGAGIGAVIAALYLFSQAGAGEIKRIAGADWVGCSSKEHYQELIEIAVGDDENAFADMISSGRCFALKDGAPVTVIDETSSAPGIIAVRGEGSRGTVWTASDAIR